MQIAVKLVQCMCTFFIYIFLSNIILSINDRAGSVKLKMLAYVNRIPSTVLRVIIIVIILLKFTFIFRLPT